MTTRERITPKSILPQPLNNEYGFGTSYVLDRINAELFNNLHPDLEVLNVEICNPRALRRLATIKGMNKPFSNLYNEVILSITQLRAIVRENETLNLRGTDDALDMYSEITETVWDKRDLRNADGRIYGVELDIYISSSQNYSEFIHGITRGYAELLRLYGDITITIILTSPPANQFHIGAGIVMNETIYTIGSDFR